MCLEDTVSWKVICHLWLSQPFCLFSIDPGPGGEGAAGEISFRTEYCSLSSLLQASCGSRCQSPPKVLTPISDQR